MVNFAWLIFFLILVVFFYLRIKMGRTSQRKRSVCQVCGKTSHYPGFKLKRFPSHCPHCQSKLR